MTVPKTLPEREKELQALLSTPEGRQELQELEVMCRRTGARLRPPRASVITYILVHERAQGLISG